MENVKIITFDLYGTFVDWNSSIGNFLDLIGKDLKEDFFKEEFKIIKNIKDFIPYSSILKETIKNVLYFNLRNLISLKSAMENNGTFLPAILIHSFITRGMCI